MQKVSLESPNHVLHSVNAHCWPIQDITEDNQESKKENCHSSQSTGVIPPVCIKKKTQVEHVFEIPLDELQ